MFLIIPMFVGALKCRRIICNLSDLAPECADPHKSDFPKRILLYDQHPGGTGVSLQVNEMILNPGKDSII